MNPSPLDQLRFAQWQELLGTRFRVAVTPARMVELELIEAEFHGEAAKANGDRSESFSLMFTGAAADRLTQRTYQFNHEKIGGFDLFIVPIAVEAGTMRYQAVINRLGPPS